MNMFGRLPTEIILHIIRCTADFAGLDGLLLVSPQANTVFQANSRLILEDLLASWTIGANPRIQNLIRQVVIIRLPSFRCANLDEYLRLTSDVSELLSQHGGNEAQSAIRDTIHLAARIQRLACAVLSAVLQNFRAALKASLSESPSGLDKERKTEWPPSCGEEYQTYWALWRLQHYYDLRKAAGRRSQPDDDNDDVNTTAKGGALWGGWSWTAEEIKKLDTDWDGRFMFCTNATWSVLQVIKDDLGYGSLSHEDFPQLKEILHCVRENPMPLFAPSDSFFDTGDYPVWSPPPAPLNTKVDIKWSLSTDRASNESISGGYFRSLMSRTANRVKVTRLWDLPALRRLGVCLWDRWRMYSAGLMECPTGRVATPDGSFVERPAIIQHYLAPIKPWLALIGKEVPCD